MFLDLYNSLDPNQSGIVGGAILGFLLSYCFEFFKRPNIQITINPTKQYGPERKWMFINAVVQNKERKFPFPWRNANINHASAWIEYQDYDTSASIKSIRARWSSTKQPISPGGEVDLANLMVIQRETIPIGEAAEIPILLKVNDTSDLNLYAFNNESYELNTPRDLWRKPDFSIGNLKRYLVKIRILADGHEKTEEFILLNPFQDGSLESISIERVIE